MKDQKITLENLNKNTAHACEAYLDACDEACEANKK